MALEIYVLFWDKHKNVTELIIASPVKIHIKTNNEEDLHKYIPLKIPHYYKRKWQHKHGEYNLSWLEPNQ